MLQIMIKLLGGQEKADLDIAEFALGKSEDLIKNFCNISSIPTELERVCISIAIDIFRSGFYGNANIPAFIRSIDLGDTKTTYENQAKKEIKDDTAFLNPYLSQLKSFRKLRGWS